MSDNPLSGTVQLDTTNYKAGVSELNRQIRVIETGFKASAAAMGDWDKTSVGMEERIKTLSSAAGLQQQKVDGLNKVYKDLAAGGKTSAKALEDLQIQINQETERLNKMNSALAEDNATLVKMGTESSSTGKKTGELKDSEDKAQKATLNLHGALGTLKDGLKTVGTGVANLVTDVAKLTTGLAVGLMGAITGVVTGIGAGVLKTAEYADGMDELAQKTGISSQKLQELKYIADKSGTDFDTLTGSTAKLAKNMEAAQKWGSPAAQAFREMGVATRDSNGQLRDVSLVLEDSLNALGKIPNETERNALAMQVFGKSAEELGPMMQLGKDGIAQMTKEAHDMGAVMSNEDVRTAADLNDAIVGLKDGLAGIGRTVMSAFVPQMTGIVGFATDFIQKLATAIKDPKDPQKAVEAVATTMTQTIVSYIAKGLPDVFNSAVGIIDSVISGIQGVMPMLLPMAAQIISTLIDFLAEEIPALLKMGIAIISTLALGLVGEMPALLQLGLDVLSTLLDGIMDGLPKLMAMAGNLIGWLITTLMAYLPKLLTTGFSIVTTLIKGIVPQLPRLLQTGLSILMQVLQGMLAALPQIIPVITSTILMMVNTLITMLPQILTVGIQILVALVNRISQALPSLIPVVVQLVLTLAMALIQNLPTLIQAALQLVLALAQGLIAALPVLIAVIPDLMQAIVKTIITLLPLILTVAVQIITTLVLGIVQNLPSLVKAIADGIGKMVQVFKTTDWKKIGNDLVAGISKGFMDQWDKFSSDVVSNFNNMVTLIKKLLGIKSPSTVFAEIGQQMANGIGVGFAGQMRAVKSQINATMAGFQGSSMALAGVAGGTFNRNSTANNYYGPVTIVQGQAGKAFQPQKASRF